MNYLIAIAFLVAFAVKARAKQRAAEDGAARGALNGRAVICAIATALVFLICATVTTIALREILYTTVLLSGGGRQTAEFLFWLGGAGVGAVAAGLVFLKLS